MKRLSILCALMFVGITSLQPAPASTSSRRQTNDAARLQDVRTVYVADLGPSDAAKALRQEIIRGLSSSSRIAIVDDPATADAVLKATIKDRSQNVDQVVSVFQDSDPRPGSKVVITKEVLFRLASRRNQQLWSAAFPADDLFTRNQADAARSLGNKVVKRLRKAHHQ